MPDQAVMVVDPQLVCAVQVGKDPLQARAVQRAARVPLIPGREFIGDVAAGDVLEEALLLGGNRELLLGALLVGLAEVCEYVGQLASFNTVVFAWGSSARTFVRYMRLFPADPSARRGNARNFGLWPR